MERELKDANDLVEAGRKKAHLALSEEAIESMSPSAARASSLLKSGMTLTQVSGMAKHMIFLCILCSQA